MKFVFLITLYGELINLSFQATNVTYIENLCVAASYCDNHEPCSSHGNCYVDIFLYYNITSPNKTSSCKCNTGWITTKDNPIKCCYQKKLQSKAFLLEFIIGFGSGHFYIGHTVRGFMKLSFSFLLCLTFWLVGFLSCYREGSFEIDSTFDKSNKSSYFIFGSLIIYFLLQIFDSVLFGINYYLDGNGQPLEEW